MSEKNLAASLHPLERKVLPIIEKEKHFPHIVKQSGLQEVEVMRALQWLQNKKIIRVNQVLKELIQLDENGLSYKESGLPEMKFLSAVSSKTALSEIRKKTGLSDQEMNICIGLLKRKAAIDTEKDKELLVTINDNGKKLLDKGLPEQAFLKKEFPLVVANLSKEEKAVFDSFQKRSKLVKVSISKDISAEITEIGKKVLKAGVSDADVIDRLTPDVLKSGEWKNKDLRSYDVAINVPAISGGRRHFVNQAISYIKKIWLDMGFTEMTGPSVQSAFWDLDALFVPQDHPARDMQDTFYLKDPKTTELPKKFADKVKVAHENGGDTGSKGWGYKWSAEEAMKLMLITHDTYLSARTLANTKKEDLPIKTFQIMKVFRNEALSWKHLFEFYQVGGIVVDPNANFKHLKGYLKEFFAKMDFPDVRIRPAHFPYTEPSAEVDVWHPEKKQWVEVAGSGLFRPEMVKPLLGIEVPVLAWGIGLERSLMEYYGFKDVRDLYKNDLKQLRETKLWMK